MCGICLLVRQRVVGASVTRTPVPASAQEQPQIRAALTCTVGSDTSHVCSALGETVSPPQTIISHHAHDTDGATCIEPLVVRSQSLTSCVCTEAGLDVKSFLSDTKADTSSGLFPEVIHNLRRRGPNTFGITRRSFSSVCQMNADSGVSRMSADNMVGAEDGTTDPAAMQVRTEVAGIASVLGLRGRSTVAQPYDMGVETDTEEDGSTDSWDYRSSLMWNGEIFGGALCPPPWGSDTVLLASRLSQMELECVKMTQETPTGSTALPLVQRQRIFLQKCTALFEQQVEGPYSFIFIATRLRLAVYGRDPLGRHSLLTHVRMTAPREGQDEWDVELIVTSVGVQHSPPASITTTTSATGDANRSSVCSSSSNLSKGDIPILPSSDRRTMTGGGAVTSKRPRHEKTGLSGPLLGSSTLVTPHPLPHSKKLSHRSVADEEDEEDGGDVAAVGSREDCWQEVGVTGLFGIPLQTPLAYDSIAAAAKCADVAGTHSPVTVVKNECGELIGTVYAAQVHLLHCPWQRTNHLVHPLLRTGTLPMVPHEPPPFERILAHEEIAVLPEPLLQWARHLMKSSQPEGSQDQSWVDWAAAHYMLALAVSMHRRITVANAGAADVCDVQELTTARQRPLCVLFSGGIDCTVIAALAHYLLPVETPIELVNVAFGATPEQAPDRIAALRSMEELLRLPLLHTSVDDAVGGARRVSVAPPEREWRLIFVDIPSKSTVDSAHIKDLLVPRHTVMDLDIGTALWHAARASGRMQRLCRSDVETSNAQTATTATTAQGTRTSPLSTGCVGVSNPNVTLDKFSKHFRVYTSVSTTTSASNNDTTIDISSSANPTALCASNIAHTPTTTTTLLAPAISASDDMDSVANLQKYQILVDILIKEGRSGSGPHTPVLLSTLGKEYSLFLHPHIKRYGYKKLGSFLNDAAKAGYLKFAPDAPSKAVRLCRPYDMQRAAAVPPSPWFTTRYMKTKEPVHAPDGSVQLPLPCPGTYEESYVSQAKVVLLGMGADETLGGYTRYRRFFQREGMRGAWRELERDFARLWQRNLGRDDRITMDSGREPRFPYLDEGVVRTLEWVVLKRRNSILATYNSQSQHAAEGSAVSEDSVSMSSPTSSSSPHQTLAPCSRDASSSLTSDELLRLSIEPIVSFRLNLGEGDKRVLRRVASVLGLGDVTHLQKRAIQFGSRVAERKVKGTTDF